MAHLTPFTLLVMSLTDVPRVAAQAAVEAARLAGAEIKAAFNAPKSVSHKGKVKFDVVQIPTGDVFQSMPEELSTCSTKG